MVRNRVQRSLAPVSIIRNIFNYGVYLMKYKEEQCEIQNGKDRIWKFPTGRTKKWATP